MKKHWIAVLVMTTVLAGLAPGAARAHAADDDERVVDRKRDVVVISGDETSPNILRLRNFGRGFLGISVQSLTPELRSHFGVPEDAGVIVSQVMDDGPAAQAGVRVGDILTSIDNEPIENTWDVVTEISQREKDSPVNLEIWRSGKIQTITASVGEREGPMRFPVLAGAEGLTPEQFMAPLFQFNCDEDDEHCSATFEFHTEEMGKAMERMREALPRYRDRVFSYQVHGQELEARIKELEARLQEMQKRLEEIDE